MKLRLWITLAILLGFWSAANAGSRKIPSYGGPFVPYDYDGHEFGKSDYPFYVNCTNCAGSTGATVQLVDSLGNAFAVVGNPAFVTFTNTTIGVTNAYLDYAISNIHADLATLNAKDFATQTTLALIKTAIDSIKTDVDKIPSSPAQESGNLATIAAKDFATQTTLALIKTKTDNIDTATSVLNTGLGTLHTDLGTTIHADLNTTLHGDFVTLNAKDFATQTTLALMKTALDSVKTDVDKIPTSPAQEAGNLATIVTRLTTLLTQLPAALDGANLKVHEQGTAATTVTKSALTANSPTFATVGVSSAQALASNSGRTGAVFVNTSSNTISCGVGATAVLNSGVTLLPYGSWTMDAYSFATGAVNCIASGASSNLAIQEFQ